VKLSQQTGDHAAACDRWSEAHARIEASIRNATTLAKRKEEAKRKPEMARTLTSNENVTIAGQARCDVLADHDVGWSDLDHVSMTARGRQRALHTRKEHKPSDPKMTEPLSSIPDDLSLNAARAAQAVHRQSRRPAGRQDQEQTPLRVSRNVRTFRRAQPAELNGKTPEEIVAWTEARRNASKLSPSTINANRLGSISTFIDIADDEYDRRGNPCAGLALKLEPTGQIERRPCVRDVGFREATDCDEMPL